MPVDLILGTNNVGPHGKIKTIKDFSEILDLYASYGNKYLDCAYIYPAGFPGEAETFLGELQAAKDGKFVVDTKLDSFRDGAHTEQAIYVSITSQLARLKVDKIRTLYLHAPDRTVSFEATHRVINELYQQGKFERFGMSNYRLEEIIEFAERAEKNGWVAPSAYEGLYNIVSRKPETELLPVLRKYNISFYAYSPLASGFFSNIKRGQDPAPGGQFDPNTFNGGYNQSWFFKDELFTAIEELELVGAQYGIPNNAIALRWLRHHSQLSDGDAILVGYSKIEQLKQNLEYLEQGSLPDKIVQVIDSIWESIKDSAPESVF
ncbi:NADP-dependent oxidoreductase domain-containing protein [Kockiozyma suomiensis]|uniref:NADP-dependent oxidoreductase domain-containing protein n=1 Tax=Kockiozyma suomiensis TaxID=1337062 RepID=UPI003343A0A8